MFAEPNNTCVSKCEEDYYKIENSSNFCIESCN